MLIGHHSTPVVLLGAFHHGGLAITRSLGRLGVPVYVVESTPVPASRSRYCRGLFRLDLKITPVRESLAFLLAIPRRLRAKPILIPTTDYAALFVVDHASILEPEYRFPKQLADVSHALVSKRSMSELAIRAGIPTPLIFSPQSRSEALAYADKGTFPLVLKADDCGRASAQVATAKTIVYNRDQLLEDYNLMQDPEAPNLIMQEYIPGGEDSIWMFNGYFNADSECLFGMTGKKIRQNPAYTGASSLAVCIQNETVHQLTLDFMKNIGYRGILDIGYKYDARDGRYKVLDVNPRIGATFRLFAGTNGMDVARALYLDLTGQTIPHSLPAPDGRKWTVEDADLVSSYCYYRDGKLTPGEWIRSLRGIQEFSFLSGTDPLPMFSALASDLRRVSSRLLKSTGPVPGTRFPEASVGVDERS